MFSRPFNRTIVELKYIIMAARKVQLKAFNRTIVELKSCYTAS